MKIFKKLMVVIFSVVFVFSSMTVLSATESKDNNSAGYPGEDTSGGSLPSQTVGTKTGPTSGKQLFGSNHGVIGIKFSLVNKETLDVKALYYMMTFNDKATTVNTPGPKKGAMSTAFHQDWSYYHLYNMGNNANTKDGYPRAVCGLIKNGKYTNDCVQLPESDGFTTIDGIRVGVKYNAADIYGTPGSSLGFPNPANSKLAAWMRGEDTWLNDKHDFNGTKWYHTYEMLMNLDVCNIEEFKTDLKTDHCTSVRTLYDAIYDADKKDNIGLKNYVIIAEPIWALDYIPSKNKSGDANKWMFSTLKGLASYFVNTGMERVGATTYLDNWVNFFYTTGTHGTSLMPKALQSTRGYKGRPVQDSSFWTELADPRYGENYNIWDFDSLMKDGNTCTREDTDKDGIDDKFYDKNGNEVSTLEEWENSCACQISSDSKYYDKEGKELPDRNAWVGECICQKISEDECYIQYPDDPTECDGPEWKKVCDKGDKCEPEPITSEDQDGNPGMPNSCSKEGTEGTIKDPAMCNILANTTESYKTEYGNSYCAVYCRENIKFEFMDKETVIAGMSFTHKLTSDKFNESNLSLVTKTTRECGAEINYDGWKSDYDSSNNSVRSDYTTMINAKAAYDSADPADPDSVAAAREAYDNAVSAYNKSLDYRDTLLYQIQDCNMLTDKETTDASMKAFYNKPSSYETSAGTHSTSAELKTYNKVVEYDGEKAIKINITYDENEKFKMNFPIKVKTEYSSPEVTKTSYYESNEWEDYCGECLGDPNEGEYQTETASYYTCSNGSCSSTTLNVPSNKFVDIKVYIESITYQSQDLYTEVYSGDLYATNCTNSEGRYCLPMNPKSWPTDLARETGDYDINVTYDVPGQDRPISLGKGTFKCAYHVVNDLTNYTCDDGEPTHLCYECDGGVCDETSDNGSDFGVYFRSIDLNDIFPNNRKIGYNWNTKNAGDIIAEIEKLGDRIWTDKKPKYSITLTPSVINKIKDYNKGNGYLDYSISCNEDLSCTSSFINKKLKEFGGTVVKENVSSINDLFHYKKLR